MRHQVDLMNMGQKGTVKLHGMSYRYVLSVMDVFRRFGRLFPVSTLQMNCETYITNMDLLMSFNVIKGASLKELSRSFATS